MRLGICGLIFAGLTAFAAAACAQAANPATAATPSPNPFPSRVLRQTTFNIPFSVETARQPLEVQLYLSRDRGQTWKLYARQNPSARFFPFHATEDGEYWFASQTIDADRPPAEMQGRQPELHVVIDTVQPRFEFQAEVGASRQIQVTWRCADPAIDPNSLKIEYQAGREQPWQPVSVDTATPTNGTLSGSQTFVPSTAWVELQVRAEISDLARNKTVVTRRLAGDAAARSPRGSRPERNQPGWHSIADLAAQQRPVALPPTTPPPATSNSWPPVATNRGATFPSPYPVGFGRGVPTAETADDPNDSAPGQASGSAASGVPADPYANLRPSTVNSATAARATAAVDEAEATSGRPSAEQSAATHWPADGDAASPDAAPTTEWKSTYQPPGQHYGRATDQGTADAAAETLDRFAPGGGYPPRPSQVHPLVSQQMPSSRPAADPPADHPAATESSAGLGADATAPSALRSDSNRVPPSEVRMTSARRFELDYEFDAAAANGVRSVELWGTRDEGQTWSLWQEDADRRSPVEVQIDAEGVYGFRIVIVGNNGLAGQAPRNGDDAEIWVGVDTTQPDVRITAATYGDGEHAGKLEIRWKASDANFGDSPVTILFSDAPTGPWTTIAAGVPNSGQFFWPIDPRVPEQLYLRIEVRDRAGNRGEYRLPDPVNLSGFTPKARIRGMRPLTRAGGARPSDNAADPESAPRAIRNPYLVR